MTNYVNFFLFSITKQMFAATDYVNLPPNKYLVYIIRRRVRERTWAVSAYQYLIWQFSIAFRVFCPAAFFPKTNGLPLGLCLRRSPNNLTLRRQPNKCSLKRKSSRFCKKKRELRIWQNVIAFDKINYLCYIRQTDLSHYIY